jgi:hypothetical protein
MKRLQKNRTKTIRKMTRRGDIGCCGRVDSRPVADATTWTGPVILIMFASY